MPEIEPPPPKAQRLLGLIVEQIASGRIRESQPESFLAFSEALELLGDATPSVKSGARLTALGLSDLHTWIEEYEELPKITALIVYKESRRPHEDFPKWHGHENDPDWEKWWLEEANRAINYDWSPYLLPGLQYREGSKEAGGISVREEVETSAPDYRSIITIEHGKRGGHPTIRGMRITVGDILGWLAIGMTETEIISDHPELTIDDIRASLAYAAERERRAIPSEQGMSRLSMVASRWAGKFDLPESDPTDPRRDYLLKRYWRHRK